LIILFDFWPGKLSETVMTIHIMHIFLLTTFPNPVSDFVIVWLWGYIYIKLCKDSAMD
jgi:hypothetical protein